ncbi:hypothetical protein MMC26_003597 [Xylographa opegraphella]|nr:hypothetical protein [Xylographa opegraphella]
MPNWQSTEAYKRLLAAVLAAHPDKKLLDYRRIATYFGDGATYDSMETQFRKIRGEAARMREAVESGARAEAPARGSKRNVCGTPKNSRKPRNASKKNDTVSDGRITKSKSVTPTKKGGTYGNGVANPNAVMGVKEELCSSASSMMGLGDMEDGEHDEEVLEESDFDQDSNLYTDKTV